MIPDDIKKFANKEGLPEWSESEWPKFKKQFTKDETRVNLAKYIIQEKPPFPFKKIKLKNTVTRFQKLSSMHCKEWYLPKEQVRILEKFDYKYDWKDHGLYLIDVGPYYNDISDYFMQEVRMTCGAYSFRAPLDIWESEDLLKRMNWTFWRTGICGEGPIDAASYRNAFRLGSYVATQFKPPVAKFIYDAYDAKTVLDFSSGWGDRLAGFYTSRSERYIGVDPNPVVYENYKKQCMFYERILTGKDPKIYENDNDFTCVGKKIVTIHRAAAEDVDFSQYENLVDVVFTSPPYFVTEEYNKGGDSEEDQSWFRYDTFEKWRDNFLYNVMDNLLKTLKDGGYMMINITDPKINSKRHLLCDHMVPQYNKDGCYFVGQIGMRMVQRPKVWGDTDKETFMSSHFIEPIWTFRKGNSEHELPFLSNNLDRFLA